MAKHRHQDINMRASWIFLSNDVIANLGVVIAGILVTLLHSRFPDLIMGSIIAIIVLGGGIKIIRETRSKTLQSS
jgi:Co/Zn/Cd efflux system component